MNSTDHQHFPTGKKWLNFTTPGQKRKDCLIYYTFIFVLFLTFYFLFIVICKSGNIIMWHQYLALWPPVMRAGQGAPDAGNVYCFGNSPFGAGFWSCDCFLTFSFCTYMLRWCSLESCVGYLPRLSGTPYNKPRTKGGVVFLTPAHCHRYTTLSCE